MAARHKEFSGRRGQVGELVQIHSGPVILAAVEAGDAETPLTTGGSVVGLTNLASRQRHAGVRIEALLVVLDLRAYPAAAFLAPSVAIGRAPYRDAHLVVLAADFVSQRRRDAARQLVHLAGDSQ